jgi:hypothetical protein
VLPPNAERRYAEDIDPLSSRTMIIALSSPTYSRLSTQDVTADTYAVSCRLFASQLARERITVAKAMSAIASKRGETNQWSAYIGGRNCSPARVHGG